MFVSLLVWTGISTSWWVAAVLLVHAKRNKDISSTDTTAIDHIASAKTNDMITIFKPLPANLHEEEKDNTIDSLKSWIIQLDENSELLLGVHLDEFEIWNAIIEKLDNRGRIKIVCDDAPLTKAINPKISWMKILTTQASGSLWLWSDADIRAPKNALFKLRNEFIKDKIGMLTCPYVISEVKKSASILDALFVNVEFYPGVLLLDKRKDVSFGLGAGMLFRKEDYLANVDVDVLGSCLADDYHLGKQLLPVSLSQVTLSTQAADRNWSEAVAHYYRWVKTIRWNEPIGFAAQVFILPLIGWIIYLLASQFSFLGWAGFISTLFIEFIVAFFVFKILDSRLSVISLLSIPLWSIIRVIVWVFCWLPFPVSWRGRLWYKPFASDREF